MFLHENKRINIFLTFRKVCRKNENVKNLFLKPITYIFKIYNDNSILHIY